MREDPEASRGSVTVWYERLREGDSQAVRHLWDRYYPQLVRLARSKGLGPGAGVIEGEEAAAAEAFHDFYQGASRGQFETIHDRDDLWKLLFTIVSRKVQSQIKYHFSQKRDVRRTVGQDGGVLPAGAAPFGILDDTDGREPGPATSLLVAEECKRLLDLLDDEELRLIAVWRMDDYTHLQIAERLNCSLRTVSNRIERIRDVWTRAGRNP